MKKYYWLIGLSFVFLLTISALFIGCIAMQADRGSVFNEKQGDFLGASSFPTSLDSYSNGDTITPDIVTNLQGKVGVNSSSVTTSLDYQLNNTSSHNPGHKHTLNDLLAVATSSESWGDLLYFNGSTWETIATTSLGITGSGSSEWTDAGDWLSPNETEGIIVSASSTVNGAFTVGAYTLPATDGSSGYVLKTDGSGALTWQDDNTAAGAFATTSADYWFANTSGITPSDQITAGTNISWSSATLNIDDAFLANTGDTASGDFTFDTDTLKIDASGDKVGVGTSTPQETFSVEASATSSSAVYIGTGLLNWGNGICTGPWVATSGLTTMNCSSF